MGWHWRWTQAHSLVRLIYVNQPWVLVDPQRQSNVAWKCIDRLCWIQSQDPQVIEQYRTITHHEANVIKLSIKSSRPGRAWCRPGAVFVDQTLNMLVALSESAGFFTVLQADLRTTSCFHSLNLQFVVGFVPNYWIAQPIFQPFYQVAQLKVQLSTDDLCAVKLSESAS